MRGLSTALNASAFPGILVGGVSARTATSTTKTKSDPKTTAKTV